MRVSWKKQWHTYTHTRVCVCTCMWVCLYTHTHEYVIWMSYIDTDTYICYIDVFTQIHIHVHICYINVYTHRYMCICYMNVYIHMYNQYILHLPPRKVTCQYKDSWFPSHKKSINHSPSILKHGESYRILRRRSRDHSQGVPEKIRPWKWFAMTNPDRWQHATCMLGLLPLPSIGFQFSEKFLLSTFM